MSEETRTELDLVIRRLQTMEEAEGVETAIGGMLHAARTILQDVARIQEYGGELHDDERLL
ncbi:MAG TPA: hypothetical protein VFP41_12025 [Actinomycetota bacterium]|nr:hypothetical protein [Actinomycetota bacterium]